MKKKTLLSLPPLQQDLIKATLGNPKWDSLVDNIIKRKISVKKQEDPFKKEYDELKESYEQSKKAKKEREKLLKELDERNGF